MNDLKKRLMDHAWNLADEAIKEVRHTEINEGDADIWRYAVNSAPGGAFHDESCWDDATVSISFNEYIIEWPFCPSELSEWDMETYAELFAGMTYSISAFKRSISDSLGYRHVTKVFVRIENPNNSTRPIWVQITHDYGRC